MYRRFFGSDQRKVGSGGSGGSDRISEGQRGQRGSERIREDYIFFGFSGRFVKKS